jgi:hypothetical protein
MKREAWVVKYEEACKARVQPVRLAEGIYLVEGLGESAVVRRADEAGWKHRCDCPEGAKGRPCWHKPLAGGTREEALCRLAHRSRPIWQPAEHPASVEEVAGEESATIPEAVVAA